MKNISSNYSFECPTNYSHRSIIEAKIIDVKKVLRFLQTQLVECQKIALFNQAAKLQSQAEDTQLIPFQEKFSNNAYFTKFVLKKYVSSENYITLESIRKNNLNKSPNDPGIVVCCGLDNEGFNSAHLLQHVLKTHFIALEFVTDGNLLPEAIARARKTLGSRRLDSLILTAHGDADAIHFNEPYRIEAVKKEHFPLPSYTSVILFSCDTGMGIASRIAEVISPRPVFAPLIPVFSSSLLLGPCCPLHGLGVVTRDTIFEEIIGIKYFSFDHCPFMDVPFHMGTDQGIRIFQKSDVNGGVTVTLPCRAKSNPHTPPAKK